MKMKVFAYENPDELETAVNEWLAAQGDKIRVTSTNLTMTAITEHPEDGSYAAIVSTVWYSDV
jgi:hypothetical protein